LYKKKTNPNSVAFASAEHHRDGRWHTSRQDNQIQKVHPLQQNRRVYQLWKAEFSYSQFFFSACLYRAAACLASIELQQRYSCSNSYTKNEKIGCY